MNIPPLQSRVNLADVPLDRLASVPGASEEEKVAEATRQFEAVLLRQILHSARKTVFASDYHSDSAVGGIYQDMVTEQLAEAISRSGSFGLARSLQVQVGRQDPPADALSRNKTLEPGPAGRTELTP